MVHITVLKMTLRNRLRYPVGGMGEVTRACKPQYSSLTKFLSLVGAL